MSTGIPFGAHPTGGAPPTSAVKTSSYFGAPSGNSPTDTDPFHFSRTQAPASAFTQPHPPPQQPSQSLGPPSASNFFLHSNPNVNIFNPGAPVGGGDSGTWHQQASAGDSFGMPPVPTIPVQPPQAGGLFTGATETQQTSSFSGSTVPSNVPPQSLTTEGHGEDKVQTSYQGHSSAPSLPDASNLFGAPLTYPGDQPGHIDDNFFSSVPSNRPRSGSHEAHSHPPSSPRPNSHEPPSPVYCQPEAVGGSGSFSAPSTALHQVLPLPKQLQQHQQQAISDHSQQSVGQTESPTSSVSPTLRPPSGSGTHSVFQLGTPSYQMTNADYSESNIPLSVNPPGVLPNQVHPSLTEDLGITNASHPSLANLRTNASVDADVNSITAAIEDATTPDDVTSAANLWSQSSPHESQEDGGSGRERDSSVNLDSKSVSSLLEGSQGDFSSYSPIRLMPPAPLGNAPSLQTQPTSQVEQCTSSSSVSLLPALPSMQEHGHEKKGSDDLKDWEIVDSLPLTSEMSQLPSSIRLLPPSSFATVSTESGGHLSDAGVASAADNVWTGVSQPMQQLSLETSPHQAGVNVVHPPQPPPTTTTVLGHVPSPDTSTTAMTGHSFPSPSIVAQANDRDNFSSTTHLNTNYTNLGAATASHEPGHHRQGHSEIHLSSNLPEPKEISSLITQIPFLTPISASAPSSGTAQCLQSLQHVAATAPSVAPVPPVTSLQGGALYQPPSLQPPPSFSHEAGALRQQGQREQRTQLPVQTELHPHTQIGPISQSRVQVPSSSTPSIPTTTGQTGHTGGLLPPSQPSVTTGPSTVSAHPSLPPPVQSATSATGVPSTEIQPTTHSASAAAAATATTVDSTGQPHVTAHTVNRQAPLDQTGSAFAQVHPLHVQGQAVEMSNPHGRPELRANQQQQGKVPPQQSLSGATVPLTSLLTSLPAESLQKNETVVRPIQPPPTTTTPATLQPAVHSRHVGSTPHSQATVPQMISSSQSYQPVVESQHFQSTHPPPPLATAVTTDVESTSSSQLAPQHPEEGYEGTERSHRHHRPTDDRGGYYHNDPYYPSDRDVDRGPYYGGPRERYRAPSTAFSEHEVGPYHVGYHPRAESRPRYDYSHYPDHSLDAGYRYGHHGPTYGGDDPYHRGGYPPLYGHTPIQDEYGMPVHPPYYDHHPYEPYRYPHHDHRYGGHYPPPPRGYYGGEYDYHPPYPESGYDSHGYPQPSYGDTTHEELPPADASAIGGQTDNFEMSQFVASPNARFPGRPHPQELQHNSTAYLDPQREQLGYPSQQDAPYHGEHEQGYPTTEQGYGQGSSDSWYYSHDSQYPEGHEHYAYYTGHTQAGDYQAETVEPEVPEVESTPPPPPRDTPELFAHPHVRAVFGFGGQLVTVLPNYPGADGRSPIVEITFIKDVVNCAETCNLIEAVNASPSPFITGDMPKSHVVRFASREAQKCRENLAEVAGDDETSRKLEDEALLWDFLVLLCQQNGVVVTSDVSDLLMRDCPSTVRPVVPQASVNLMTQDESLDALRQLLFAGRKRDAVDMACSKNLWGHALMLASRMDEQTRTYVVNRFTASLMNTDPLSTFYTLLLGRTPSAVKPEGLPRAGDWKPHLAMILANCMSKLENSSIVSLGDSLLAQKRLHAAHLCYHLANVHFGVYGNMDSKYSLLGIDHTHLVTGSYPQPSDLHMMEVLEYAMCLSKQDFLMPNFQLFKFLYVFKLLELGFVPKALKYCEQISCSAVVKNPHCFAPVFLHLLVETSVRLHHLNSPFDVVENEFPSWLHQLQQVVADALSTDYAPSMFSPSPAFSSVSQSYVAQPQIPSQPIIGLQATTTGGYLNVPGTAGGSRVESGASSKEGSVINMKIDVTTAQLTMRGPPPPIPPADGEAAQSHEATTEQQPAHGEGGFVQPHTYDANQFQTGYDLGSSMSALQQEQRVGGGSEEQNQTQAQVHPQVNTGSSDTGYGQIGASADGLAQLAATNSNLHGHSNVVTSIGYMPASQVHVQPGQQYGTLSMSGVPSGQRAEFQLQQQVEGTDASAGGGAQVPYDSYSGLPSTAPAQASRDQYSAPPPFSGSFPSHPPPSQPGFPPQLNSDYSQWGQLQEPLPPYPVGDQRSSGDTQHHGNQELETSSGTKEGAVPSHGSHVTEKKAGEGKETSGKDGNKKGQKNGKQQQGKSGGGWGLGILNYILPKKKNEAHLPDDKNPTIVWDEEKKQWVDLTADEEDQSAPPPPPTDSELNKTRPPDAAALPPSGGGYAQIQPPSVPLQMSSAPSGLGPASGSGGGAGGVDMTDQGTAKNTYSMQRNRKGGLRSKYVDVLNPGGTKSSSGGPPPPGPPTMMSGPPQPFSGTFFVPQHPPVDDVQDGNTSSYKTDGAPTFHSEAHPADHRNVSVTTAAASVTTDSSGTGVGGVSQEQAALQPAHSPEQFQSQQDVSGGLTHSYQGHQTSHPRETQRVADVSSSSVSVPQQPQFFNPSAFAQVNTFPHGLSVTTATTESQDDALSTVSLISESSQEVSQYMNRQVASTSSAGYSRLKQGIRGVKPYPSLPGGGVQQQRPHPGHAHRPGPSGPPPMGPGTVRNSFQPRQPQQ